MDKNLQLVALSESGRFWKVDFAELTEPERVFVAVYSMEGYVNMGGFASWYEGCEDGAMVCGAVDALRRIGGGKAAAIVESANRVAFPTLAGGVPPDEDQRRAIASEFSDGQSDELNRLDQEFYEYPDDLIELLHAFVVAHLDEIEGAKSVIQAD